MRAWKNLTLARKYSGSNTRIGWTIPWPTLSTMLLVLGGAVVVVALVRKFKAGEGT
jgi:hypothetical protein